MSVWSPMSLKNCTKNNSFQAIVNHTLFLKQLWANVSITILTVCILLDQSKLNYARITLYISTFYVLAMTLNKLNEKNIICRKNGKARFINDDLFWSKYFKNKGLKSSKWIQNLRNIKDWDLCNNGWRLLATAITWAFQFRYKLLRPLHKVHHLILQNGITFL